MQFFAVPWEGIWSTFSSYSDLHISLMPGRVSCILNEEELEGESTCDGMAHPLLWSRKALGILSKCHLSSGERTTHIRQHAGTTLPDPSSGQKVSDCWPLHRLQYEDWSALVRIHSMSKIRSMWHTASLQRHQILPPLSMKKSSSLCSAYIFKWYWISSVEYSL